MVLARAVSLELSKNISAVSSVLHTMDIVWTADQDQLKKKRLAEKCAKKQQHTDYVMKLLVTCKSWGGPCTSKEELLSTIQKHPDKSKSIISSELAYYVHTHQEERAYHPELFRQVKISIDEKVENLCLLLSGTATSPLSTASNQVSIPTNEDALALLNHQPIQLSLFEANELCVTMWWEKDTVVWYIGYFKSAVSANQYMVEHLVRKVQGSNVFWIHADKPSADEVEDEQILKRANGSRVCVNGQWDFGRTNTFCLKNIQQIELAFNQQKASL